MVTDQRTEAVNLNSSGYIEMSKNSRNSRFHRKADKNDIKSDGTRPKGQKRQKKAYGMKIHNSTTRPISPNLVEHGRSNKNGKGYEGGAVWIWGAHACEAVLANPRRTIHELLLTEQSAKRYNIPENTCRPRIVLTQVLSKSIPRDAVHQGIALKTAPLEWQDLDTIAKKDGEGIILVLDQITDPHNVGAMLRLCSAFGVRALVMQTRNAPPLSGASAKVAVGCLETIPVCLEVNIANTLERLKKFDWMVTGLDGNTDLELKTSIKDNKRNVLVMGAEGKGLRERVKKTCDQISKIPMNSESIPGHAESLNVATAAAIALYETRR